MEHVYRCEQKLIEKILEDLQKSGLVSRQAFFNYDAKKELRSEVAYRDFDFLTRLCRASTAETIDSILGWLKKKKIVSGESHFDNGNFDRFRSEVKDNFDIPGTSITPVMERLLYMLSYLKQPRRAIGLGTYCGYALIWAVGAGCGQQNVYTPEKVYGIDIDEHVTERARRNFANIANTEHVELIAEEALQAVERIEGPFDYVYLDVESKEFGKRMYFDLIKLIYKKVQKGGWVLAHDTVAPPFATELEDYLTYVKSVEKFKESISFDIDPYGLELSIKH
jgi:predicted O-methyltransferase YrrM